MVTMAELALLHDLAQGAIWRERNFRDRADLLAGSDEWLISRFRLPRPILLYLCNILEPNLTRPTQRSHAIPAHLQVLSVLGFLATGTFQREIADRAGISQPSMSRILPTVLTGINNLMPEYIQFPYGAQRQLVKQEFCALANMPNVIGAMDCTHVRIKAPSDDAFAYINRKKFHSVNVQLICDAKCVLLNVVARWPGGTHDSFILRNSAVGTRLENGAVRDGWLIGKNILTNACDLHVETYLFISIGDRGYPLTRWLMTPLTNPQTPQELRYNEAHAVTRAVIERTNGVLKARWLCLDHRGRTLLYAPEKVCKIIMACCVLHNISIKRGLPIPDVPHPPERLPPEPAREIGNAAAVLVRQRLIERF